MNCRHAASFSSLACATKALMDEDVEASSCDD